MGAEKGKLISFTWRGQERLYIIGSTGAKSQKMGSSPGRMVRWELGLRDPHGEAYVDGGINSVKQNQFNSSGKEVVEEARENSNNIEY